MNDYIGYLFAYRDAAHKMHLKTKSFAKHLALGELYEFLTGKVDELTEVIQGQRGIIDIPNKDDLLQTSDEVTFIKELCEVLTAERASFNNEDPHVQNILDEITAFCFRIKYKIDNLA